MGSSGLLTHICGPCAKHGTRTRRGEPRTESHVQVFIRPDSELGLATVIYGNTGSPPSPLRQPRWLACKGACGTFSSLPRPCACARVHERTPSPSNLKQPVAHQAHHTPTTETYSTIRHSFCFPADPAGAMEVHSGSAHATKDSSLFNCMEREGFTCHTR